MCADISTRGVCVCVCVCLCVCVIVGASVQTSKKSCPLWQSRPASSPALEKDCEHPPPGRDQSVFVLMCTGRCSGNANDMARNDVHDEVHPFNHARGGGRGRRRYRT